VEARVDGLVLLIRIKNARKKTISNQMWLLIGLTMACRYYYSYI
jgi:hypothetical protein